MLGRRSRQKVEISLENGIDGSHVVKPHKIPTVKFSLFSETFKHLSPQASIELFQPSQVNDASPQDYSPS